MPLRTILLLTKEESNRGSLSVILANATGAVCIDRLLTDVDSLRGLAVDAVCYTPDVEDVVNSSAFREVFEGVVRLSCYGFLLRVDRVCRHDLTRRSTDNEASENFSLEEWLGNHL